MCGGFSREHRQHAALRQRHYPGGTSGGDDDEEVFGFDGLAYVD